jgi:DNA-directed RNA polymerase specialized sigma24 family protein
VSTSFLNQAIEPSDGTRHTTARPGFSEPGFSVALDVRIRNLVIAQAAQRFGSVKALAAAAQVSYSTLNSWSTLSKTPWRRDGKLSPQALRVAEFLQMLAEDCFPAELYRHFENSPTRMLVVQQITLVPLREARAVVTSDEEAHDLTDLGAACAASLSSLSERQTYVLTRTFGLDGSEPATYREIGIALAISVSRVAQIANEALRKLRHPRVSNRLRPFFVRNGSPEQERQFQTALRAAVGQVDL